MDYNFDEKLLEKFCKGEDREHLISLIKNNPEKIGTDIVCKMYKAYEEKHNNPIITNWQEELS